MATNAPDRFDHVPDDLLRTGAHRAAPKSGRGWIAFAWAALATGVPALSPTPTPTIEAKIDPALPIAVLNGTPTKGLATKAGNDLVKQGWAGASEKIGSRTNAGSTTITKTVVYYGDAANAPAARAMVLSLKIGEIRLSPAYPGSPITVVLGSDYVLPAG